MTIMTRMTEKGALLRKKEGKQYVYRASKNKALSSNSALERIKESLFGGKNLLWSAYLIEKDTELSDQDLKD